MRKNTETRETAIPVADFIVVNRDVLAVPFMNSKMRECFRPLCAADWYATAFLAVTLSDTTRRFY